MSPSTTHFSVELWPLQHELHYSSSCVHYNQDPWMLHTILHLNKHSGEQSVPAQGPSASYSLGRPVTISWRQRQPRNAEGHSPTSRQNLGLGLCFLRTRFLLHSSPASRGIDLPNALFGDLPTFFEKLSSSHIFKLTYKTFTAGLNNWEIYNFWHIDF